NCVLLMLTIVRLRPSSLDEWNKGPSVVADCSIGYYSCFTACFFTAQFTRSVGDLQLSNTSSTPKIGQKGNNYCIKLQQLSSELSDFPACSAALGQERTCRASRNFPDDRRLPRAVKNALFAPISADVEREASIRRGEPVRFLVATRRFRANIERERPV